MLEYARVQDITPVEVLRRLDQVAQLTSAGRRGLTLLSEHLGGISFNMPAAHFVPSYLFSRGRYLDRALARSGLTGQQERLALFQFMQFVFEHNSADRGDPKRGFIASGPPSGAVRRRATAAPIVSRCGWYRRGSTYDRARQQGLGVSNRLPAGIGRHHVSCFGTCQPVSSTGWHVGRRSCQVTS